MSGGSPEDTRSRMVRILDDSVNCALGLKDTLVGERAALESRDTDSLNDATTSKTTLIDKLARLNQARGQISEQAGFGSSTEKMDALAEWCDDESLITDGWQHFREIASECDVLNKTNGAIIHMRRQQMLDGLSLLRGEQREPSTYTPTSNATSAVAGRTITEA